jgi:hypothetical protein
VVAGGGGAFLHPAPMFEGRLRAEVRFPTARQSRALLGSVPWKVAAGRSGLLPHLVLAAIYGPALAFGARFFEKLGVILAAPVAVTVVAGTVYALIGGLRVYPRRVLPLAYAAGLATAIVPILASLLIGRIATLCAVPLPLWVVAALTLLSASVAGAWIFGAYLALLTRLGLENTQAFTALDHPGFKHFVRLRVRADGKGVDGFCIGLVDPLHPDERPRLVDRFCWRPGAEPSP